MEFKSLFSTNTAISETKGNRFTNGRPETLCRARVKVSPHILAVLFDLPSVLRDNSLSITEHFQTETENASIRAITNIIRRRCGVTVILVKFDAVIQEKCPKLSDKCSAVAEMGDRLATIDMGRKLGAVPVFFWGGELGPHLAQFGLGRGLHQYQVAS